jgi:S1-C subfamily serine protease
MAEKLQQVSDALAAAVDIASASTVRIEARRRFPASGIAWSPDGVIVTAHHVVEQQDAIQIGLADGQTVAATLVGRDPTTDVAVLRAQTVELTPPVWADVEANRLHVGHLVLAVGRPGRAVQATLGVINTLGDSWRTPAGGSIDRYVQTDVVMYPGFSGGPLLNAAGEVVGMNTSGLLRDASLTVPVSTLRRVVEMLLAHGRMRRGFLGVSTQPVRLPAALAESLGQETGLLLTAVEPAGPAEQDGLLLGDTLVGLNGQPVRQHDDLLALMVSDRIGTTVLGRIIRGGQVQELQVRIGERP